MATIRIADPVKPERPIDERRGRESVGGIYNTRGISIDRRRSKSRLRRFSVDTRSGDCEEGEDEDPGLRQAGDFKEKQVCVAFLNLCMARILNQSGFQRHSPVMAYLPEYRRDLWRYWNQSALRLFFDFFVRTFQRGSYWSPLDYHMDSSSNGYREICPRHSPCRQ